MMEKVEDELDQMSKDPLYDKYAYVTYDDIKQMSKDSENTLLAIRAPRGSTLDVVEPEPGDPNSQHQIQINSQKEEIQVFMITNDQTQREVKADLQGGDDM
jgi:transcription factor E2F3